MQSPCKTQPSFQRLPIRTMQPQQGCRQNPTKCYVTTSQANQPMAYRPIPAGQQASQPVSRPGQPGRPAAQQADQQPSQAGQPASRPDPNSESRSEIGRSNFRSNFPIQFFLAFCARGVHKNRRLKKSDHDLGSDDRSTVRSNFSFRFVVPVFRSNLSFQFCVPIFVPAR